MATTYQIQTGPTPAQYEVVTGNGAVTYEVITGGRGPAGANGASTWNALTGTLEILPFDTSNGGPVNKGEVGWTSEDGCLTVALDHGVMLQVGEETLYRVDNNTGSTIANGTPVMYAGTAGNSGRVRVKPWDGTEIQAFMGFATSEILDQESGYVTHFGKVRGIQTNGANYGQTWVTGDLVYAVTGSANLTKTKPTAGGYLSVAAVVSSSANNGTLLVRPTLIPSITDIGSVANNDSRLSDARTPTAHKSSHATGGSDALTAADIGAAPTSHTHTASQISNSTATGRSLMTTASASAARTALGLGNAALATTSTGGNGTYDSGKVATYNASGNLTVTGSLILSTVGEIQSGIVTDLITAPRVYKTPNASGTHALTESTTGIPDNLVTSSTKTTPIDADSVLMTDSEAAGTPAKRLTFGNLWTWITTKIGALTSITAGGAWSFSSTTRPTSSGTGTPAATSLITRDDGDSRYLQEIRVKISGSTINTAPTELGTLSVPSGTWWLRVVVSVKNNDNVTVNCGASYSVKSGSATGGQMFKYIRSGGFQALANGIGTSQANYLDTNASARGLGFFEQEFVTTGCVLAFNGDNQTLRTNASDFNFFITLTKYS